jgi:hypothetical protein
MQDTFGIRGPDEGGLALNENGVEARRTQYGTKPQERAGSQVRGFSEPIAFRVEGAKKSVVDERLEAHLPTTFLEVRKNGGQAEARGRGTIRIGGQG